MEAPLTILYTANLRGELAFAPRLFSYLRGLRAQAAEAGSPVLLVDLGGSADMQVWHNAVTGGRSSLFALDAMGYDAANATHLHPQNIARMQPACRMALLGEGDARRIRGARVFVPPLPEGNPATLNIVLIPSDETAFDPDARVLMLQGIALGQVGAARVSFGPKGAALASAAVYDVPAATPPDPTVTGAIEFILSEADYVMRKAQGRT
jgi:hypothetical protein